MKWRGLEDSQQTEAGVPLRERLQKRRELITQYVPLDTRQLAERMVAELQADGAAKRALAPGASAPQFTLQDHNGASISSQALLSKGRLVVIFFRGRWCPFCVAQLEAMSESAAEIRAVGAELIAISPQTTHQSSLMHDQHRLNYSLLSDPGNKVARSFGLVYRVPEYQQKIYSRTFTNLPFINGDPSWELPLAATFILQADGRIGWATVSEDYTQRPEPAEILSHLTVIPSDCAGVAHD